MTTRTRSIYEPHSPEVTNGLRERARANRRVALLNGDSFGFSYYAGLVAELRITDPQAAQTVNHNATHPTAPAVSVIWVITGRKKDTTEASTPGGLGDYIDEWRFEVDDYTRADVVRMSELGERWHLNDLKAGCAHIETVYEDGRYGRQPVVGEGAPVCGESGYRWGSAWLHDPIPADVLAEILALWRLPEDES